MQCFCIFGIYYVDEEKRLSRNATYGIFYHGRANIV